MCIVHHVLQMAVSHHLMTAIDAIRLATASTIDRPLLLPKLMTVTTVMLIMCGLVTADQQTCPSSKCVCSGTELVDCRNRTMTSVPSFRPNNIFYDTLRFSDNSIQHIGASAFGGIRFRKLEIVNNPLKYVDPAAFSGLESTLTDIVLDLDETAVEFPHRALLPLVNLTVLKVAHYSGSELPVGALRGLRTLRELRLTSGNLETLTAADVAGQRHSLVVLDVSDNKLREFPTDAIRSLTALRVLNFHANLIEQLGGNSVVSRSLRELDISNHALDQVGINSTAFDGVTTSLRRLVMSTCHLYDRHAAAITHAASVTELVLPFNHITSVRTFLADMSSLKRLDVQNNSVDMLTAGSLPPARRLRALNLANNPLRQVHPHAFRQLRFLEDLKLDHATAAMPLDGSSFASQRSTLRNLSLIGVNLSTTQWSVINGLERLEMLSLSKCQLGNIPPFTFRHSGGQLHTIVLAGNRRYM